MIASQPPGTGRQTTLTELYVFDKTERRIMTSSMVAGNVQFHLPRSGSKTRRIVRCRNTGAARGSSKPNVGVAGERGCPLSLYFRIRQGYLSIYRLTIFVLCSSYFGGSEDIAGGVAGNRVPLAAHLPLRSVLHDHGRSGCRARLFMMIIALDQSLKT